MITLSIGTGLVLSFIFAELTGLSAGGLIVPGYLALYLDQPLRVGLTLLVALATYLIVEFLANHLILYGRRRFISAVLIGFCLGWLLPRYVLRLPFIRQDLEVIGYIIPGLIANDAARQGIWRTFAAVLFVSALVRLVLLLAR